MLNIKIAKRYSKALFRLAQERDLIDKTYEELMALTQLGEDSKEFKSFILNPSISDAQQIAIINNILKGKVHELTFTFLTFLAQKDRLTYFFDICQEF